MFKNADMDFLPLEFLNYCLILNWWFINDVLTHDDKPQLLIVEDDGRFLVSSGEKVPAIMLAL
jgi:hypothetical protein